MTIRTATLDDYDAIWDILKAVIKTGDTYPFSPNTAKTSLTKLWFADYMNSYVIEQQGKIIGSYIIKPNQVDLGSHVANCSYIVHPDARGKGAGKMLCEHSIQEGKKLGYKALQFNLVVSTNHAAVHLWQKCGLKIIGTIPEAFNHQTLGYVDAYVMYKKL